MTLAQRGVRRASVCVVPGCTSDGVQRGLRARWRPALRGASHWHDRNAVGSVNLRAYRPAHTTVYERASDASILVPNPADRWQPIHLRDPGPGSSEFGQDAIDRRGTAEQRSAGIDRPELAICHGLVRVAQFALMTDRWSEDFLVEIRAHSLDDLMIEQTIGLRLAIGGRIVGMARYATIRPHASAARIKTW
jgi:hypothetical protein